MTFLDEKIAQRAAATEFWLALFARAGAALARFGRSLVRRKAVFDLGRLDDRALSDMGLTRSDLAEASRWSLWGEPTDRLAEISANRRPVCG